MLTASAQCADILVSWTNQVHGQEKAVKSINQAKPPDKYLLHVSTRQNQGGSAKQCNEKMLTTKSVECGAE